MTISNNTWAIVLAGGEGSRLRDQNTLDAWRRVASPPKVVRRETYVKLYRTAAAEEPF
jgi:hypothetical protein